MKLELFASVGNCNRMDLKEFSVIEAFEGLKLTIQMWSRFFKVKDFVLLAYGTSHHHSKNELVLISRLNSAVKKVRKLSKEEETPIFPFPFLIAIESFIRSRYF